MVVVELHEGALGLLVVCVDDKVGDRGSCTLAENSNTVEEMTYKPENTTKTISTFDLRERDLERPNFSTAKPKLQ